MKYLMLIEIELDEKLYGDTPSEEEWLETQILVHDLILHSNDIGDTVGEVETLYFKRITE